MTKLNPAEQSEIFREIKAITVREEAFPIGWGMCSAENVFNLWHAVVSRSSWYQQEKEHMVAFYLDTKLGLKSFSLVSIGTLNETYAEPREIFRPAIADSAKSVIIAHNHPSGDPTPSRSDIALTRRIYHAGSLLQISLTDHIIVSDRKFFSFREFKSFWPPKRACVCHL